MHSAVAASFYLCHCSWFVYPVALTTNLLVYLWVLEKMVTIEKTNLSLSKPPVLPSLLPTEVDRSWAPMDVELSTMPAPTVAPPAQSSHEGHGVLVYAASATGGIVQNSGASVALSPRPLSANVSPSGQVRET